MNLSKSKYCRGIQCKKILWLEKNKPEEKEDILNQSVLDNGTEVGEFAKKLFGDYINIEYNNDLKTMLDDTKKVIENNKVCNITEASFVYNNNFCSVDILKKDNNNYEIYEVKSSTSIKDIYLDDASYQYYVLTSLGYNVTKVSIVYINSKYVRGKELELDKLFIIEDITNIAKEKIKETPKVIEDINNYMKQTTEPEERIDMHCEDPYSCPFFNYCTRNIEKPNVFAIAGMHTSTKFKLFNEGKYTFKDLLDEDINPKYKEQIDFEINNKKEKIEKEKIIEFLNTLSYPLFFLDFETYQQTIPLYEGIRPYQQIPFQYSLHYYEDKNKILKHKEFLATPGLDPRRSLAEQLVKDIPKDVCVLAYNMSFEKTVIKQLAEIYPDLSDHLLNIRDNIKDLMIPFINRNYYNKSLEGSYSIKYVLPTFFPDDPSLNYHNLEDIHNGSEAMNAFANMEKLSQEDQEKLRNNLLKYCELDTYAMVKIYDKLLEITNF